MKSEVILMEKDILMLIVLIFARKKFCIHDLIPRGNFFTGKNRSIVRRFVEKCFLIKINVRIYFMDQ